MGEYNDIEYGSADKRLLEKAASENSSCSSSSRRLRQLDNDNVGYRDRYEDVKL
jgi:hypothetical protein